MIQIEVKNFQSIRHVKLNVEGFTALVGRSNIGKSALIRAVRCALSNSTGTGFVRHDEDCIRKTNDRRKTCKCKTSVHLKTEDFDLLWEKGDSISRYTFNGEEFSALDKGVPEFLVQAGFAPVKTGSDIGTVQVSDQFFPIFLLHQSGPAIAESISDVSRLDRINAATKLAEKERREVMATRKVRTEDVARVEGELSFYESLGARLKPLREAEATRLRIEALAASVGVVGRYKDELAGLLTGIQRLSEAASLPVPDLRPVCSKAEACEQLYVFNKSLYSRAEEFRALAEVVNASYDCPVERLAEKKAAFLNLDRWIGQLRSIRDKMQAYNQACQAQLDPIEKLSKRASRFIALRGFLAKHRTLAVEVQRLEKVDLNLTGDVDALRGRVASLSSCAVFFTKHRELSAQVGELEGKLTVLEKTGVEIRRELGRFDICPTCSQPVAGGHVHA